MRRSVAVLLLVGMQLMSTSAGGYPYLDPTVGRVWPQPQHQTTLSSFLTVLPSQFSFLVTDETCSLLERALDRYLNIMFSDDERSRAPSSGLLPLDEKALTVVEVRLSLPCEDLPHLSMDEAYEIKIDSPDEPGVGSIESSSVWGVLRGLESLSQLLIPDGKGGYFVNSTQIIDFPRFPYRGFMIDTSRHYLPVATIKEVLDAMSVDKYNVLHWHIVDDQSFPYESEVYPELSAEGAWDGDHVYSAADLADVVAYATDRGIRIIPEFDTPGHTLSWGDGQPGLLTECYADGSPDGSFGPIDPSKESTYDFLGQLYSEVSARFPDLVLHLGGDEVPFDCWRSNPEISEFMDQNDISSYRGLENYYITRLIDIVSDLSSKNGYMVWQEVFDNNVDIKNNTIVHIWKGEDITFERELDEVTAAGYQALLSSCWYLNVVDYGPDWYPFYECDPHDFPGTDAQKSLVVGGEACMWGEWVDRTNIISTTWPRASVVAERLWSDASVNSTEEAAPRLEEHRCRLLARGYDAEPLGPSYCPGDL